jgi:enamine deaminase RidA (YjgF/YER057c/UK114 family)
MTSSEQRLKDLGITLPAPAKPVANYVGWMKTGQLVFTAGQLPYENGKVSQTGILGAGVDKDAGKAAARIAAINVIAQLRDACGGDLGRIARIVKLTGFVACTAEFSDQPYVINGASDLMVEVFGEIGRHARSAVGVASLPLQASVEVEAIAELI